jgi:hypothetical protein
MPAPSSILLFRCCRNLTFPEAFQNREHNITKRFIVLCWLKKNDVRKYGSQNWM